MLQQVSSEGDLMGGHTAGFHATPTGISVPLSFPILRPAASSRGPELCFCVYVIYRRCLSAWLTLSSDGEIRPHEEGLLLAVLSML